MVKIRLNIIREEIIRMLHAQKEDPK